MYAYKNNRIELNIAMNKQAGPSQYESIMPVQNKINAVIKAAVWLILPDGIGRRGRFTRSISRSK
jgi:hypothetical protein